MNKNIIFKRILMIALTILMILLELSFWPGYLAHDFFWSKSNSAYGNYNSPYAKGVSTTQYFIRDTDICSWMSGIDRQTASRKDGKVNIVIFALKKHAMFTSASLRFTEMRSE